MDEKELLNKITSDVKEQIKGFVKQSDVEIFVKQESEKIIDQFKGLNDIPVKLAELEKAAIAQGEFLAKMKNQEPAKELTIKQQLEANKDNIRRIVAGDRAVKTTVIPSAITSGYGGYQIPGVGQIQSRKNALRATLNQSGIASNNHLTIRYMDQTTATSGASSRTVGQAAGEFVIAWTGYNLNIEQYSHMIPIALEMLEDFDFVENEVRTNLLKYLDLAIEYAILNGDGSTPDITGILGGTKYTAFSAPTGLATNVDLPGVLDVIMAAAAVVRHNTAYQPNYVWMNDYDLTRLQLEKTTTGEFKFPNFLSADGANIGNIKLIGSPLVTANTMFVGDFSVSTLYSKGVTVTMGLNDDDFSKRKVTLLANESIALLTKALDITAISYISDVNAAIGAITKSGS